jgi:hypothetical protein
MGESGSADSGPLDSDGDQEYVDLVRVIDRTIHRSPTVREKEREYHVRNGAEENFNYILLPLREFKPNLQIFDENGDRLNYYPNREVKDILADLADADEDAFEEFQHRFKHADYKVYIQLPPDRPLRPGELRTIRLTYEQTETVEFHDLTERPIFTTQWKHWRRKVFDIPSFAGDAERFPGHGYDIFIKIMGPDGYSAVGESNREGGEPAKEIYENYMDHGTRVLSIRLPPAESKRYSFDLLYDLVPNNQRLMQDLALYFLTSLVTGAVLVAFAAMDAFTGLNDYWMILSAAFMSGTVGLVFTLDSDWSNRYRLLSIIRDPPRYSLSTLEFNPPQYTLNLHQKNTSGPRDNLIM